jgi:hypothetical protein
MSTANPNPMEKWRVLVLGVENAGGGGCHCGICLKVQFQSAQQSCKVIDVISIINIILEQLYLFIYFSLILATLRLW